MNDTLILALSIGGTFVVTGIVFLIAGIVMKNNSQKIRERCTQKTIGKVIDIAKIEMDRYDYTWVPIFEYMVGERKFKKESRYGGVQNKYKIGQEIEVYYNPENPNDSYIGKEEGKSTGFFAIIIGATVIGIGIFVGISIIM